MTAAPGARRVEGCGKDEWTGMGQDSIKSQRQETQLGVIGTPRQGIYTHARILRCHRDITRVQGTDDVTKRLNRWAQGML